MNHRHTSFEVFQQKMMRALLSPTIDIPGSGVSHNPLAHMDEGNNTGPIQAMIRAWSMVGDVLTFYQERIAEERVLSTAREDFSAYAMTRMLGYEPQPMLSARAWLCFAASAQDENSVVTVRAKTPVANVPKEGKLPAVFETEKDLDAYPSWNGVTLALASQAAIAKLSPNATRLVLQGTDLVAPGTVLVVRVRSNESTGLLAMAIAETLPDRARDVTLVRWQPLPPDVIGGGEEIVDVRTLEQRVRPFGALAPPYASASALDRRKYARGGVAIRSGGAWQDLSSGLDLSPSALVFGRTTLFGISGARLYRRTAREPWTVTTPFTAYPAQCIAATPSGLLAVGTVTGNVLISIDDGTTWSMIGDPPVRVPPKRMRFQMQRLPSVPVRSIAIDESGDVPTIFVATDRGVASIPLNGTVWTWKNSGFPGTDPKTGIASLGATSVILVDAAGTLLVTTTYGVFRSTRAEYWTRVQGVGSVSAVAPRPGGNLIAIGPGGAFGSDDTGGTWHKLLPIDGVPRALASNGETVVVAVDGNSYISDDAGRSWAQLPDVLGAQIQAVAAGRDGAIAIAAPFVDYPGDEWPGLELSGNVLRLDREVAIAAGDVIAVSQDVNGTVICEAYVVRSSVTSMLAEYGMVGLSTQLLVDRPISPNLRNARTAIVHVGARMRAAVQLKRESPAPPLRVFDVPRGLPRLPAGRKIAVEGCAARVYIAALAGAPLVLDAFSGTPGGAFARIQVQDGNIAPVLDVDAAAPHGENGVVLSRFDGVWHCADLVSGTWEYIPAPPLSARSVASFGGAIYAACVDEAERVRSGVYVFSANAWRLVLAGAVRRIVAVGGLLWACSGNGLYQFDGAVWRIADPIFERRGVNDIAARGATLLVGTDNGAYVRARDAWQRISGLDKTVISAVALSEDTWYAGTTGAGTWQRRPGEAVWTSIARGHSADVQALWAQSGVVLAAERGVGVTNRGESIDATLAGDVRAFVPVRNGETLAIVAFLGTPVLPPQHFGEDYIRMRRYLCRVSNDESSIQTLDAGMLAPSLRLQIEASLNVKLSNVEVIVEQVGSAWRLRGSDSLPLYSIRREPDSLSIFEIEQFDMDAPPVSVRNGSTSCRWAIGGDWTSAPALIARDDELWYAPARPGAPLRSEIAELASQGEAQIVLNAPLRNAYDPLTVKVCGNVVEATHGATIARDETILSGNASISAQSAPLAGRPLTNILADTGPDAQLQVWVRADVADDPIEATAALANRQHDDEMIEWTRIPDFAKSGSNDPHYILRQDPEGGAVLTFGDGESGRRLPTGTDNVVARYRIGGGKEGNVDARELTLFQQPHGGLDRVYNALPAKGGVDAERAEDLRKRATLGMVALRRVVSEQDLYDYVASWPGVKKVDVSRVLRRSRSMARSQFLVTVAPADVDTDALETAVRRDGAASFDLRFTPYIERKFFVHATLRIDPDRRPENVVADARAALLRAYSFDERNLREDVLESAIVALLQQIVGVRAVALDALLESSGMRSENGRLDGGGADLNNSAALFIVDPDGIELKVQQ